MTIGSAPAGIEATSPSGSFALEVDLEAPPGEVWQALVRGERRSHWLRLPGRPGPQAAVDLDLGVKETLHAHASVGNVVETLQRDTYVVDLATGRRLTFAYRVVVNEEPRWASLVTVHVDPRAADPETDGTHLVWSEQYTFVTPPTADDVAHLRGGTRLLLTALAVALGATPRPATAR